ncbi:MAG: sodium:proton antiporter, partial [Gelidibacter sp.]|nr:sodium:proton antiporter [Gelidibacter sp.]
AGTDLFTHIRYMLYTTVPTIIVTLIIFIILGFNLEPKGVADTHLILQDIKSAINVSPWLFLVPVIVIVLIVKKTPPLIALLIGTLLGGIAALIFQPSIVAGIGGGTSLDLTSGYKGIMNAITVDTAIPTDNKALEGLFKAGGMSKMLGTIWLILCAMVFGGI